MVAMKIREIILADLQDGMKVSEISRVMWIDESTIYRLKAKYEQTGSLKANKEFSGAVNLEHFLNYVTNFLTPSLHSGDIVVMDNLCTHKVDGVQQAIQSVGAQVLYLPPYSPDFNPIKMLWSKIKSILRKRKARTLSQLHSSIPKAYILISLSDIFA